MESFPLQSQYCAYLPLNPVQHKQKMKEMSCGRLSNKKCPNRPHKDPQTNSTMNQPVNDPNIIEKSLHCKYEN